MRVILALVDFLGYIISSARSLWAWFMIVLEDWSYAETQPDEIAQAKHREEMERLVGAPPPVNYPIQGFVNLWMLIGILLVLAGASLFAYFIWDGWLNTKFSFFPSWYGWTTYAFGLVLLLVGGFWLVLSRALANPLPDDFL